MKPVPEDIASRLPGFNRALHLGYAALDDPGDRAKVSRAQKAMEACMKELDELGEED